MKFTYLFALIVMFPPSMSLADSFDCTNLSQDQFQSSLTSSDEATLQRVVTECSSQAMSLRMKNSESIRTNPQFLCDEACLQRQLRAMSADNSGNLAMIELQKRKTDNEIANLTHSEPAAGVGTLDTSTLDSEIQNLQNDLKKTSRP